MTNKTRVHPSNFPEPEVALSQGIISGDFLFISGAVANRPGTTEIVGDDIKKQTRQVMANLQAVLSQAGLTFDDVVQSRAYLVRVKDDFRIFDAVYGTYFSKPLPSRTTIGVELAIPGLLVEVDMVARLRS
ncbi:RidA family protein [Pseudactinotalea sp. Z1748]|uniref:RidA family protein n=1 Tax=Pseudactinotalea sp. Z1748 TaxID=3413027 RepID=UPI003C7CA9A1